MKNRSLEKKNDKKRILLLYRKMEKKNDLKRKNEK